MRRKLQTMPQAEKLIPCGAKYGAISRFPRSCMLNQVEIGKSRHKRNSPPKKESAPVEEPGR